MKNVMDKQTIPIPKVKKVLKFIETAKAIPKEEFEPSMKVILRIMRTMTEDGSINRTDLAHDANLNYGRLRRHIVWLEEKGLVKSITRDTKTNVVLTQQGRIFLTMFVT